MLTMTVEKKIELMEKLLKNVEYQLIEHIATRDFNKKAIEENPAKVKEITDLIITVEMDIRQTNKYGEFVRLQLEELKNKKPDEVLIILEDKKNEKA
jgi:DNA integrity scanning protein DisA with diadenylate cyclase activity